MHWEYRLTNFGVWADRRLYDHLHYNFKKWLFTHHLRSRHLTILFLPRTMHVLFKQVTNDHCIVQPITFGLLELDPSYIFSSLALVKTASNYHGTNPQECTTTIAVPSETTATARQYWSPREYTTMRVGALCRAAPPYVSARRGVESGVDRVKARSARFVLRPRRAHGSCTPSRGLTQRPSGRRVSPRPHAAPL